MKQSRQKTIFTGVHDLFIRKPANGVRTIRITTECGGAAERGISPNAIPQGTVVRLRRREVSELVAAFTDIGSECTQNRIDISPAMAQKFRIINNTRYRVFYNSATRVLCLRRKPVTKLDASPNSSPTTPVGTIGIGDGLADQFGINVRSGTLITVAYRRVRLRLRYVEKFDPSFFSYEFTLNSADLKRLGLTGKRTGSAYNQITRTLVLF
ncbi:hypothetical protein ACFPPD_02055 [Cohnella suwonensis]|uniref:Uncharacterized protein n=1 Tax=Cohnella suwonensis TaxID=696072 RepID=A0ABW0LSB6_9BACL